LSEHFDRLRYHLLWFLDLQIREGSTAVFVVDALYESVDEQDVQRILRLLPLLQDNNSLHVRIFLTKR
jgi:hypothetical protein